MRANHSPLFFITVRQTFYRAWHNGQLTHEARAETKLGLYLGRRKKAREGMAGRWIV